MCHVTMDLYCVTIAGPCKLELHGATHYFASNPALCWSYFVSDCEGIYGPVTEARAEALKTMLIHSGAAHLALPTVRFNVAMPQEIQTTAPQKTVQTTTDMSSDQTASADPSLFQLGDSEGGGEELMLARMQPTIAAEPPPYAMPPPTSIHFPSQMEDGDLHTKLSILQRLLDDGLVTAEEHNTKKAALIDAL